MKFCEQVYKQRWARPELEKVSKVWEALVKNFFQSLVGDNAKVLDIGCGFCHFLNHLQAKEKVVVDANPDVGRYASSGVTFYYVEDLSLRTLPSQYFVLHVLFIAGDLCPYLQWNCCIAALTSALRMANFQPVLAEHRFLLMENMPGPPVKVSYDHVYSASLDIGQKLDQRGRI